MSPKSHVSVPPLISQNSSPVPPSIDHSRPSLVASTSVRTTSLAVPGPALATVIRNPTWSAASTVSSSAVLVTEMPGHSTTMSADEVLFWVFASFVALTVAVLCRTPQSSASVTPVTWIVRIAPDARSPKEQLSTPLAIEQSAESSCHATPAGKVSVRVTFLATPGPLLVTTIVNFAVSPALIVPLSAVLTTTRSGQFTVIVTGPVDGLPSLPLVALAALTTCPHVAEVVGEDR